MTLSNAVLGLVLAGTAFAAAAQSASPAGAWKTIDDATKKEKSVVRIVDTGGVYSGRIEKLLESTMAPDAVCKECTDDRKDKPVVGLVIVRNMKQSADDKTLYEGGDMGEAVGVAGVEGSFERLEIVEPDQAHQCRVSRRRMTRQPLRLRQRLPSPKQGTALDCPECSCRRHWRQI